MLGEILTPIKEQLDDTRLDRARHPTRDGAL
jgi:hypothetical protein